MNYLIRWTMVAICTALFAVAVRAEETKPEAPKPDAPAADAPKTDAPKTDAAAGELPKAPEGVSQANTSEALVGTLHKGPMTNAKGKVKKGSNGNPDAILLTVDNAEVGKKGMKNARQVTLTATGDILTQLTSLADKSAHVKVSGSVTGDTMTVKEASEAPVDAKKKKKKDNA